MLIRFTFLIFLFYSFSGNALYAQTLDKKQCHTMENLEEKLNNDPSLQERIDEEEAFIRNFTETWNPALNRSTITIPVVFHVLHNGDAVGSNENISATLLQAQLDQLNLDYRAQNPDVSNVPSEFAGLVADLEIEFCLASVDPNGNPTTGITRHNFGQSTYTRNQLESSLKAATVWDSGKYLNFWSASLAEGLLGYAQFPNSGPANTDGVVCGYKSIGSLATPNSAGGSFGYGRTATHEVGHWLNLRHIWGDDGTSCSGSDLVSDTPNQAGDYGGCPNYPSNSCGSSDMFMNYMDYVNDQCMFMFSTGQKVRALAALNGARSSLLSSNGCGSTPTCSDVTVSITLDDYPAETTWSVKDANGATIGSGGSYTSADKNTTVNWNNCLADGCYTLVLNDSYGDGMCCSYGNGNASIKLDVTGEVLGASNGQFGSSTTVAFCVSSIPAPTCNDGIQNQGETGIDCGGPCAACPSVCTDITIALTLDTYPTETTWSITDADGTSLDTGGPYTSADNNTTKNLTACLDPGCYYFKLNDSYGDGICCSYGNGNVSVSLNATGEVIASSNGQFGSSTTVEICINTDRIDRCEDGIQNNGETGVDCGGPCEICPSCNDGIQNNDETGVDCGGSCPICPVFVSPKIFLQGAFRSATTDMTSHLGSNSLISTQEPYTALGYNHIGGGNETTTTARISLNKIVDWVVVELRDESDSSVIIATRSALLRDDGQVVDTNGESAVAFKVQPGNYYVAVRHRNHLGIMTNAPVTLD